MSSDRFYSNPSVSAGPGLVGGRYRLTGKIGEGGMGAVYRGFDQVIGRQVAIKMLGEGTTKQEEVVARFQREAQVVGQLRHRNVVEVFDFGVENGIPFMVMELLEGKDLATLLDKRGPIAIERAVDIVLAVAAGLLAAHERGRVHRDIKPANIFLSREAGDEIPKILGLLGMFCKWRRSEPFSAEILRSSATVKLVYSSFPQMRRILSLR